MENTVAENTYRKKEEATTPKSKGNLKPTKTVFQMIESTLGLNNVLSSGLPMQQMPKILFIMGLLIFYIANTHYADKVVRNTSKAKTEVEDLRADYTTLKADLMFKSKQSEVAKRVASIGLEESLVPPYKIEVEEKKYITKE
ncbi:MAG TPA: FtsL-like putative cell division protein [Cytophagaceae bacterium]|nr:FtsL-like putative cell division protein [Cytophagaceae bacterium]